MPRRSDATTCCTAKLISEFRSAGLHCGPAPTVVRHPSEGSVRSLTKINRRPLVLTVGRVEPRKAPEVLIDAAKRLAQEIPEVEVLFVGRRAGGPEGRRFHDRIVDLASELAGRVRFAEEVTDEDLRDLYARARVVAVPSHQEGFSNAALEAMVHACPVVCSSGTGVAEIIEGSKAGAVFPVGNAGRLAAALRPFLVDERLAADAGVAALALAETEFAPDRFAREMEDVYAAAVEKFRRRRGPATWLSGRTR